MPSICIFCEAPDETCFENLAAHRLGVRLREFLGTNAAAARGGCEGLFAAGHHGQSNFGGQGHRHGRRAGFFDQVDVGLLGF